MKKIIINTIIISLFAVTSIFAGNNTSKQTQVSSIKTQETTAVVMINDMNGKLVYSETFTVDTENGSNIKLNPSGKLPKGMYVVTVTVGNEKMTDKLIVK